jgi:hypothetical protein
MRAQSHDVFAAFAASGAMRPSDQRRSSSLAGQRNELVAALANEILIVHATPGEQTERISKLTDRWKIPKARMKGAGAGHA